MESGFDKFADKYYQQPREGVPVGDGPEYYSEYKIIDVKREHVHRGGRSANLEILDVGAGTGSSIPVREPPFPGCTAYRPRPVTSQPRRGGAALPSMPRHVLLSGAGIECLVGSLDIAFAMCVLHHMEAASHVALTRELRRDVRTEGLLLIF